MAIEVGGIVRHRTESSVPQARDQDEYLRALVDCPV